MNQLGSISNERGTEIGHFSWTSFSLTISQKGCFRLNGRSDRLISQTLLLIIPIGSEIKRKLNGNRTIDYFRRVEQKSENHFTFQWSTIKVQKNRNSLSTKFRDFTLFLSSKAKRNSSANTCGFHDGPAPRLWLQ